MKRTQTAGRNMSPNIKRKITIAAAAGCLVAMSCGTAWSQGNSAFGRGQKVNHFKGRGNSLFGRTNAMAHSAGHGNSAFGLGQFNGPVRGPSNSAFGRGRGLSGTHRNWSGGNWSGGNWSGDWRQRRFSGDQSIFIGGFGFPFYYGYPYYGYGYNPYGYYSPYGYGGYGNDYYSQPAYGYGYYGDQGYGYGDQGYGYGGQGYGYGNQGYGYDYQGSGYYGNQGYGYGNRSSIAQLQRRLARAGYYHGAIDGIMGPETRRAIRAYERSYAALGMR
jgi:hypothetical protein